MSKKVSEYSHQTPKKWIRVLVPTAILVVWLILSSFGGPTFGKINSVSDNNQEAFLPTSAESTKVQNIQTKFLNTNTIPAILLFTSRDKLTSNDFNYLTSIKNKLSSISGVSASKSNPVVGPLVSKNHKAAEILVPVVAKIDIKPTIQKLTNEVQRNQPNNIQSYVTGPAGLVGALSEAFNGINGILTYVAIGAVFLILLLVYRSLVLPFLVLLTSVFALSGAILIVYLLAQHGVVKLNGESQGILSILVIGASTDYSILVVSRFKEALHHVDSSWLAMKQALKSSREPIAAAAATVAIALLCLLFSELNSNKSLGPIAAIGIVMAFVSAMSFLPAVLITFGRKAFWPIKPKVYETNEETGAMKDYVAESGGLWYKVAGVIKKKYRPIWLISAVVLLVIALVGVPQFKASGVSQVDTILGKSNAVTGQKLLGKYFSAGSGSPVVIVASKSKATAVLNAVKKTQGVQSATFFSDSPRYSFNKTSEPVIKPKVLNNKVLIDATLIYDAESTSAQHIVTGLRNSLRAEDPTVLVGGTTAIQLDTNTAAKHDLARIIPIVLVVILLILILLLRSILAPVLLILSVILSFAATIGLSALLFNHVFHFPGADPAVPLFGFIFLVALGVDYNIFLMTRVREETIKFSTRVGILRGLSVTGNVITSAGIVLAATFAALSVIPILFLVEIAFIVAFGVLLDTIIVRSLIIPALCYDIGKLIWWPSKLSKKTKG